MYLFIYLFLCKSSRLSNAPSNRSETNDYWLNELSVISLSRGFDWLPPQWGSVDASPLSLWFYCQAATVIFYLHEQKIINVASCERVDRKTHTSAGWTWSRMIL